MPNAGAEIAAFNAENPWIKRGLALTPVKFGISFTLTHMNQAGALVHVYTDGSVMLNHGGTEMGQGLYMKVAQVVAAEFGIAARPREDHRDHDGEGAEHLAHRGVLRQRPERQGGAGGGAQRSASAWRGVAAEAFGVPAETIVFADGMVRGGGERNDVSPRSAKLTHRARVQLSSTGYYRTPKIHYDTATHRGRPFYYFAYGAAVAEVEIDTLTGEYRLRRVDILHDCGAVAEPGARPGPDRGRLRAGHGLADHRGTVVGRRAAGCAPTRRPPTRFPPAATCRRHSTCRSTPPAAT